MATRTKWQDIYLIEETGSADARCGLNQSSGIGVGGTGLGVGVFRLPVMGNPTFSIPGRLVNSLKAVDLPEYQEEEELDNTKSPVTINYSMLMDSYNLSLFGKSLFQAGSEVFAAGGIYKTVLVYPTTSDPSYYLSTIKVMSDPTTNIESDRSSWELWGSIGSSLSISGEIGGLIKLDTSLMGIKFGRTNLLGIISNSPRLNWLKGITPTIPTAPAIYRETAFGTFSVLDASAANVAADANFTDPDSLGAGSVQISNTTGNLNFSNADITSYDGQEIAILDTTGNRDATYDSKALTVATPPGPLKFQDAVLEIDTENVAIKSFNLSVKSNPIPKYYDSDLAYDWSLGRFNATFNTDIVWSDTVFGDSEALYNYLRSSDHLMYLYWGNKIPVAENDISIQLNGRVKSVNIQEANGEYFSSIGFELRSDSGYEGLEISAAYVASKLDRF